MILGQLKIGPIWRALVLQNTCIGKNTQQCQKVSTSARREGQKKLVVAERTWLIAEVGSSKRVGWQQRGYEKVCKGLPLGNSSIWQGRCTLFIFTPCSLLKRGQGMKVHQQTVPTFDFIYHNFRDQDLSRKETSIQFRKVQNFFIYSRVLNQQQQYLV